MSRQLRDIANRRSKLALLASFERQAISESPLWASGAFLAAELALFSAKAIGASCLIRSFFPMKHKRRYHES
jgi:hypothetical protein